MGNCCCPQSEEQQAFTSTGSKRKNQAPFQGQGHRLGTADEARYHDHAPAGPVKGDDTPEPVLDPNLTEEERAKIRADRAAAAEARLKKQGGLPKKKKTETTELTGPNSKPLMTWTAG